MLGATIVWLGLALAVSGHAQNHPFAGRWVADMSKSKPHPDYPLTAVTVDISVAGDMVTIADTHVDGSGKETQGTHSFRADGREHPFEAPAIGPGVALKATWVSPRVLETIVKKDGQELTRVVYEVSADGTVMTATRTGLMAQMAYFRRASADRQRDSAVRRAPADVALEHVATRTDRTGLVQSEYQVVTAKGLDSTLRP
jgi:hypothetical protein